MEIIWFFILAPLIVGFAGILIEARKQKDKNEKIYKEKIRNFNK